MDLVLHTKGPAHKEDGAGSFSRLKKSHEILSVSKRVKVHGLIKTGGNFMPWPPRPRERVNCLCVKL